MGVIRHSCDVCGQDAPLDIPTLEHYGLLGQIVVCSACGFVYVPMRRTAQQIADSWTHDIFGAGYSSEVPYVKARLYWVAQEISSAVDLRNKTVVDVGAGEGALLRNLLQVESTTRLIGIDPSERHAESLRQNGFEAFCGTAQEAAEAGAFSGDADLVTLTWTLENSNDCREVLSSCRALLHPGGHIAIATGSRLLVPFKKPLADYLTTQRPADTHAFRFSRRSLGNLLQTEGFEVEWENQWADSDWMLLIARKTSDSPSGQFDIKPEARDSSSSIIEFFSEWHRNSELLKEWAARS